MRIAMCLLLIVSCLCVTTFTSTANAVPRPTLRFPTIEPERTADTTPRVQRDRNVRRHAPLRLDGRARRNGVSQRRFPASRPGHHRSHYRRRHRTHFTHEALLSNEQRLFLVGYERGRAAGAYYGYRDGVRGIDYRHLLRQRPERANRHFQRGFKQGYKSAYREAYNQGQKAWRERYRSVR